jgi:hypothetical protein
MIRGNVDSPVKPIAAFDAAGIEMTDEGGFSHSQGRRIRLRIDEAPAKALRRARPRKQVSEKKPSTAIRTQT